MSERKKSYRLLKDHLTRTVGKDGSITRKKILAGAKVLLTDESALNLKGKVSLLEEIHVKKSAPVKKVIDKSGDEEVNEKENEGG